MQRLTDTNHSLIQLFPEVAQKDILDYNHSQTSSMKKIPVILRNLNTGWPLLQVSLLSPYFADVNGQVKYRSSEDFIAGKEGQLYFAVLGGGSCHNLFPGIVGFHSLLAKTFFQNITVVQDDVKLKNLEDLNKIKGENLIINYRNTISIDINISNFGNILNVLLNGNKNEILYKILSYKGVKLINGIEFIKGKNWDTVCYTTQYIIDTIDKNLAVFYEGQLYVDLGKMLDAIITKSGLSKEIEETKDSLNLIFQVNKFLDLKSSYDWRSTIKSNEVIAIDDSNILKGYNKLLAEGNFLFPPKPSIYPGLNNKFFSSDYNRLNLQKITDTSDPLNEDELKAYETINQDNLYKQSAGLTDNSWNPSLYHHNSDSNYYKDYDDGELPSLQDLYKDV